MFDQFSERARIVILLARLSAGHRGAAAIDYEHLVDAILREDDQKRLPPPFNDPNISHWKKRRAFFTDETASEVLSELESVPASGIAIADSADMPLSVGLGTTLVEVVTLAAESKHKMVEPLHLLAAVLAKDLPVAEQLRRHGVTLDAVRAAIESGKFF